MRMSIFFIAFILLLSTETHAATMTFDEPLPPGYPDWAVFGIYERGYGVFFDGSFDVADHSGSTWGPPRSGSNVLVSNWNTPFAGMVRFGFYDSIYGGFKSQYINSFGGYFSTQQDVVIEIVGYNTDIWHPVASVEIGATGESWNNRWVDISSPARDINFLMFYSISSDDALLRYCADDVSVELVPEPSTLFALGAGLVGIVMKRKKK